MALTTGTLTFNLADLLGVDFDARRTKVTLTTNVPDDTLIDTDGKRIRLGGGQIAVNSDGTGSALIWLPGPDTNPSSWQTTVRVDYADSATRERRMRRFGPFTITASADLVDLVDEQQVPPDYLTTVTAELGAYVLAAEAAADRAEEIADVETTDAAVTFLIDNPSTTRTALLGLFATYQLMGVF